MTRLNATRRSQCMPVKVQKKTNKHSNEGQEGHSREHTILTCHSPDWARPCLILPGLSKQTNLKEQGTCKRSDYLANTLNRFVLNGEKDVLSTNTLKTNAKRNPTVSEEANETGNHKETPRSKKLLSHLITARRIHQRH